MRAKTKKTGAEQFAANTANQIQDAVNLAAIVGSFHRQIQSLREAQILGDELNNHPVILAFVSKLNSLCRLTPEREIDAFSKLDRIIEKEEVEYEVIPIG